MALEPRSWPIDCRVGLRLRDDLCAGPPITASVAGWEGARVAPHPRVSPSRGRPRASKHRARDNAVPSGSARHGAHTAKESRPSALVTPKEPGCMLLPYQGTRRRGATVSGGSRNHLRDAGCVRRSSIRPGITGFATTWAPSPTQRIAPARLRHGRAGLGAAMVHDRLGAVIDSPGELAGRIVCLSPRGNNVAPTDRPAIQAGQPE